MNTAHALPHHTGRPHPPGEPGIWAFVFGDVLVFTLFFCTFVFYRAQEPALFQASQALLDQNYGVINTLLLLTSSLFVVHAVDAVRHRRRPRAATLLLGALLCGGGFAVIKLIEYTDKFAAGLTPVSDNFFMYYFMLTGIHFIHVLLGLCWLGYLWVRARAADGDNGDVALFESGATFWHMVDLLWIVLFPLIYLLK